MTAQKAEVSHLLLPSSPSVTNWVIVDSQVDDLETLINNTDAENHEIFLLDADRDGIEQITQLLRSRDVRPTVLHLLAHGAPATLYLGSTELSLDSLSQYAEQLKLWSFEELHLYGCNVASGDAGEEFIQKIRNLTQANVAASTQKVGSQNLGGSWLLDYLQGDVQAEAFTTPLLEEQYAGVFQNELTRLFIQREDNANNARERTPDGDFSPARVGANGARIINGEFDEFTNDPNDPEDTDLGPIQPIEFYIDSDVEATIGSAILFLSIFDVDAPAEQNLVTFNGVELGILEGENELTFRSVFPLNNALIEDENFIQIDVNILDDPANWEAVIEQATLLVNYIVGETAPGGFAVLDTIGTNQDSYTGGQTVEFTSDIDTTKVPEQILDIETILRNPQGEAVDFDDRKASETFRIEGANDLDFFSWDPVLPDDAVPGVWSIEMNVFDVDTDTFQLQGITTFTVGDSGVVSPEEPPLPTGPLVFQFEDYIRFQDLDEGIPYIPPNVAFNERLYLLANPDVFNAFKNGDFESGAQHYALFGANEGRTLYPSFLEIEILNSGLRLAALLDETYYLFENPDVAEEVNEGIFEFGIDHFIEWGIFEARNPSYYYNEDFYLANNEDVRLAIVNGDFSSGLQHYLLFGHRENRDPSSLFDASDYLVQNPDVAAAVDDGSFDSGFDHYIEFGASEGRINTLLYEELYYLTIYPDVAAAVDAGDFETGFDHYIIFGQREGRNPSVSFSESTYLQDDPGVVDAISGGLFSSGMEHYFRLGRQEGRPVFAPVA